MSTFFTRIAARTGVLGLCATLLTAEPEPASPPAASPADSRELRRSLNQGRTARALAQLEEQYRGRQPDGAYYMVQGMIALQAADPNAAEQAFQNALRARPQYTEAHFNLGAVLFDSGRYEEALEHYRLVPAASKLYPVSVYRRIMSCLYLNETDKARELIAPLRLSPSHPLYYYAHAAWSFHQGNAEAGRYFAQSAESLYESGHRLYRKDLVQAGWLAP